MTRSDGAMLSLLLHFEDDNHGTLTVQPEVNARSLEQVELDGTAVRFSLTAPGGALQALSFTGTLAAGQLSGELYWDGAALPMSFVALTAVDSTLRQPGLWLWGGADQSAPVKLSAETLQALIDGGQSNLRYVIFPQADHSLAASAHGLIAEQAYAPNLVHCPAPVYLAR